MRGGVMTEYDRLQQEPDTRDSSFHADRLSGFF